MILTLDELKTKFKTARELLDQRIVPIDILSEFCDFLTWVDEKGPLDTVYA